MREASEACQEWLGKLEQLSTTNAQQKRHAGLSQAVDKMYELTDRLSRLPIGDEYLTKVISVKNEMEDLEASFVRSMQTAITTEREALSEATESVNRAAALAGVTKLLVISASAGLAVALGLLLARGISAPVLRLRDAAVELGKGNPEIRVETASTDEIGDLACAFNRMAEDLAVSQSYLENIVEAMADTLLVIDPQWRIERTNAAAATLTGYSEADLVGRDASMLLRGEALSELAGLFEGRASTLRVETSCQTQSGATVPVAASAALIRRPDAEGVFVVCLLRDTTQRQQLEATLRAARDAAQSASRAKSEFLANMSHEVRTPLNGIVGVTDLLQHSRLSPEQSRYVQMIDHSAQSLARIINDILDFSKIEAGELELDAVDFQLRDTIEPVSRTLGLAAEKKGLELVCNIKSDVPDRLVGDPGRLCQVIINLVNNATKFTERGEVIFEVELESRNESSATLQFSVSDTGIGIPADKQKEVFRPFRQVDASSTRVFEGTGLGLAISAQLVQRMGGRIWLESVPRLGSIFRFTARFAYSEEDTADTVKAPPETVAGMRVLVVDDNATNREILGEMLANWEMVATLCSSGSSALEQLEQEAREGRPYRLIILDCQMPEMDGFCLGEQIKARQDLAGSTIMMLSSSPSDGDLARCRDLGITAYLTKPVSQSGLLNAITTALNCREVPTETPAQRMSALAYQERSLHILLAEDNPGEPRGLPESPHASWA